MECLLQGQLLLLLDACLVERLLRWGMITMAYQNELSPKERAFCEAYVESYSAVDAYLKSYKTNNIDTAKSNSYQVLKRPRVKEYIREL